MKISVIESPQKIVIRDSDLPGIGDGDVLVRLEGTGVCASNLPVWEGRDWFKYPFDPGAPGHEGYGTVAAIGPGVSGLLPGDKVAFISGHAYAEYDKAHFSEVVKLPVQVGGKPFPGEPAACAVNVFRRSDIDENQVVLLIGAGYLGCLLIQLLKNAGAYVVVVSRRNTSLHYAKMAGADHVIAFNDFYDTLGKLRNLFPEGIPRVIEATGTQSAIDLATEITSIRGKMIIAGYHQDGMRTVNMQAWNWKGLDVINAHERDSAVYVSGLKEAIRLAGENILQPEKYITHLIEFQDINEAFRLLRDRPENFMKAVITY
ncbi:MAG TPA: zinc-binding dehydrogenase [Bacteroidales bacterium]|nr:zinc-binding dehydrogenase [Bacteroidales bacterium]